MKSAIAGAAALFLAASGAQATTLSDFFTGYYAFGDSLSDPGNYLAAAGGTWPAGFPYFGTTFSNGPVFTQYIAAEFDPADTSNYAYGFAEAANPGPEPLPEALALHFDEQVDQFQTETGGTATGALMTVLFGANDLLEELGPRSDPVTATMASIDAVVGEAITAIFAQVTELVAAGPAQIIVSNLPDLGLVPRYFFDDAQALASYATAQFNAALAGITALSTAETTVTVFDLQGFFGGLLADPLSAGITNPLTPCVLDPAAVFAGCPGFMFYDDVHPTSAVHALAASALLETVDIPLPAGLPLLLAGVAMFGVLRRRQAA